MAKLHERTVIEEIDESSDPTRFDGDLESVLIGHSDNAEDFLRTVFNFVDRKSRFFKQPDAAKKVARLVDSISTASASGKAFKGGFFGKGNEGKGASEVSAASAFSAQLQYSMFGLASLTDPRHATNFC